MNFNVNIFALVLGMLVNMGLGALWYSPALFSKVWMKEANITQEDINSSPSEMGKIYGMTALGALLSSYTLGFLVINFGLTSILDGILMACILWLGTDLPSVIKNWGFENRTFKLGFINHGYDLAVYVLMAVLHVLI